MTLSSGVSSVVVSYVVAIDVTRVQFPASALFYYIGLCPVYYNQSRIQPYKPDRLECVILRTCLLPLFKLVLRRLLSSSPVMAIINAS